MKIIICLFVLIVCSVYVNGNDDYWVKSMMEVNKKFKGEKGKVVCCGDSITYANAFWTSIRRLGVRNCGEEIDLMELIDYITVDSWNLKGPDNGNYSGWRIVNGLEGIDKLLKKHNPEVGIVMFGTNDLGSGSPSATGYGENLKKFIQKCLDNNTIAMLTTIPPRRDFLDRVKEYNQVIKNVAKEKKIPVIEYFEEIIKLRPKDWYNTLIEDDGVHPTSPEDTKINDFSPNGLKNSGYGVRNYVTLKKYYELYQKVLSKNQ